MTAGATYVPINTQTLGSAAASVTFNSIPQGYTDLVLISTVQGASAADLAAQFNGDTSSGLYSVTYLSGNGTAAFSGRVSAKNYIPLDYYGGAATSGYNNEIHHFMNYSNTTTYKTVIGRANAAGTGTDAIVGLWRNTVAITSITLSLVTPSANLSAGSTFTLYGIASSG